VPGNALRLVHRDGRAVWRHHSCLSTRSQPRSAGTSQPAKVVLPMSRNRMRTLSVPKTQRRRPVSEAPPSSLHLSGD